MNEFRYHSENVCGWSVHQRHNKKKTSADMFGCCWQKLTRPNGTCHVSHIMCHMSLVTFHVSHVMCHISLFCDKVVKLVCGGSSYCFCICILTHTKQENRLCKSEENHQLDHEVHKVKVLITLMSQTDRGSIWARQNVDEMIFWWLKNGDCIRIISLRTNVSNKYN